mmetsp:Transcript_8865/g.21664  ORF Transcript_8865/g.21664 Transcript_8865/m.21664 type:complete len:537 (+) Transcript_8865:150-1760(+)
MTKGLREKGSTQSILLLLWILVGSIIATIIAGVVLTPEKDDERLLLNAHLPDSVLFKDNLHASIPVAKNVTTTATPQEIGTTNVTYFTNAKFSTLHNGRIHNNNSDRGNENDENDTLRYTLLEDGITRLPVKPWRSPEQKALAAKCTRSGRGNIYIKHFRKAGGSAMYKEIQSRNCVGGKGVTRTGGQPPDRVNFVYAQELPSFDIRTFDVMDHADEYRTKQKSDGGKSSSNGNHASRKTLYVTSLRHPISRIESMYWYEGKWPRNCSKPCEDKKQKDETTAAVKTLEEWVVAIRGQTRKRKLQYTAHTGCGQWTGVENYYIRQLLTVDRASDKEGNEPTARVCKGFRNVTLTRTHLHQAKQILASFDVVLIQEDMAKESWATSMFFDTVTLNGSGRKHLRLPAKMRTERKGIERSRDQYQPIPNSTRRMLEEWNKLDLELYEYAVELSRSTVEQWRKQQSKREEEDDATAAAECGGAAVAFDSLEPPMSDEVFDIAIGGSYCCPGSKKCPYPQSKTRTRGFWYYSKGCIWSSNGE